MKTPVKFGKYYLLERISVGGMAEVFKAKAFGEAGFERLVAVKRILPSIAEDQEFIAMFVDEAKLAVQLTHPNIAQIFELGKVGDAYFIALEYVAGKDMRAIFERAKKRNEMLPVPMACFMVMKLCEGLDYAHNKKDAAGRSLELVHRDVSPQNILVSYDGDVKLIDFGIAKAASKSSKTQAGILKGKFGYMSPEQVRGLQVDRRSDVFAVGICLYELLTTERLFVGESDFSTLEKVRNVEITPPTFYNKKIPEELENIVLKALAKHPEDRYRSAMDLHDDLQSFMYTSGNFFARKDLAAYMGRLFEEEIRKEQARDEEFRKFDARKAAEAEVFESAAPALPGTSRAPAPPPMPNRNGTSPAPATPSAPARSNLRPAAAPIPAPPPRQPQGAPAVSAAVAVARQPTGPMPVHAAVAASAPAVTPQHVDELDWNDDESATQIMDKPADVVTALQSSPRPTARGAAPSLGPSPLPPRPGRLTGQIPSLPALPGRQPSSTALGVAPPASSLPPASTAAVAAPVVNAPPVGAVAAPVVGAPVVGAPVVGAPVVGAPPVASVAAPVVNARPAAASSPPGVPSVRPGDAFNNLTPGFAPPSPAETVKPPHKHDWPASAPSASSAAAQRPVRDTKSTALLAFFGIVAVAALVVLGLQLKGSPPQATLTINTLDGAEVTVDDRPVPGVGGRYEVEGLDPQRPHTIEIRKTGYETVTQTQELAAGPNTVRFVLREAPAPSIAVPPPVEQPLAPPPTGSSVSALVPAPTAPALPAVGPAPQVLPPSTPPPTPAPTPTAVATPARPRNQDAASRPPRPPREPTIRPTIPATPAPTARPSGNEGDTGVLLLSTVPASSCTVNGMTHSTPWRVTLPPGRYAVRCVNNDLAASATYNVTIAAGQTADYRNRPLE